MYFVICDCVCLLLYAYELYECVYVYTALSLCATPAVIHIIKVPSTVMFV